MPVSAGGIRARVEMICLSSSVVGDTLAGLSMCRLERLLLSKTMPVACCSLGVPTTESGHSRWWDGVGRAH